MGKDITLPIENGLVNLRVAAIIMKDGKVGMCSFDDLNAFQEPNTEGEKNE